MRGDIQKILSTEPLNSYSPVVQWSIVRLMLFFLFIIGLQSQNSDFKNAFAQAYIPNRGRYSLKFPGISIVMEENMMLFSGQRKSYMVNLKLHASGMKSC